ncbi:MAG: OmpA family protein [Phycisphaerae bacterium]|nr:OmpA family protein [Phycisphaerae bacterium]
MLGYIKTAFLLSAILFVALGCGCPPVEQAPAEIPPPVLKEPPPPPPPPPPAPLPPAVTKSIEELNQKYPDLFKFDKDKGLLYFSSDATFDSGSAVVKPEAKAALGKLAQILNEDEVKDRTLTLIGHTDTDRVVKPATIAMLKELGKSVDNMGLSRARAEAVAAVLEVNNVDASRITTIGKGEAEPVADNRTPEGKARNRRVEIYVTPAKSGS